MLAAAGRHVLTGMFSWGMLPREPLTLAGRLVGEQKQPASRSLALLGDNETQWQPGFQF